MPMSTNTPIVLEPELEKQAQQRAHQLGMPLADYIRQLIAQDLENPAPANDPSIIFNLGNSGGTDIARDKNHLLGAALANGRDLDR